MTSFLLLFSSLEAFVSPAGRQSRPSFLIATQLQSTSDKGDFKGSFSFVEGSDFFASEEEEIEAMGGDLSFLDDSGDNTVLPPPKENEQGSEEPVDDTPAKFEWDGEVDEDAYFD